MYKQLEIMSDEQVIAAILASLGPTTTGPQGLWDAVVQPAHGTAEQHQVVLCPGGTFVQLDTTDFGVWSLRGEGFEVEYYKPLANGRAMGIRKIQVCAELNDTATSFSGDVKWVDLDLDEKILATGTGTLRAERSPL